MPNPVFKPDREPNLENKSVSGGRIEKNEQPEKVPIKNKETLLKNKKAGLVPPEIIGDD